MMSVETATPGTARRTSLDETCERRRIIVAVHRGKNAVAPRLERQMQVRCKARLGADELEQIVRQLDRLE